MNLHRIFRTYFDVPGDPGAGGGGGGMPGGPADPGVTGTPPAPASGTPPAAGATPDDFDRRFQERIRAEGYIPRHAATRLSSASERLQAQLEQERQRVRALSGLEPQPDPEESAVRTALTRMFPGLAKIQEKEAVLNRMLEAFEEGGAWDSVVQTRDNVWGRNAYDAGGRAAAAWAKLMGVEVKDMPKVTQQRLARELRSFILDDQTGQREQRYNFGDDTLIEEFVNDLQSTYVTPFRQQQQQQAVTRQEQVRRLPQQGPKGGPPPQQATPRVDRRAVSEMARQAARERMADA